MRATRRTFRTAAIATGAIAALAVPTTAAFAADAPSAPQGQVAAGDRTGTTDQTDQTGQDRTGDQDQTGKDETGQDKSKDQDKQTDQDKSKEQDKSKDKQTDKDVDVPKPGSWESKGTTNLGKGWSAKVDVNASARTAKAAISLNGAAKGSLTAYEKSASTTIDGNTFTLSPDGTVTMKAKPTPPKPDDKRVFVRDAKLADGSTAKIYKLGPNHYQADIIAKGVKLDTLDANGRSASGQNNGLHVTLNPDGTIKSWVEGTPKPKPDTKRVYKTTVKLADGSLAKIYKLGPNHYQADIIANGVKIDTLDANGRAAHGQNNGLHVTLNPDGTIKSWVEGKNNGHTTQPKHDVRKDSNRVVPKGGVKAGADGVQGSSDDAPLIAAGSGMAAVGAAGLGFAIYRRKQHN
ncbi:hypothetical protein [Streptomyces sp. NPDC052114]|uniref:hypothetical protein n=1 Tax=unclassified Streptomyces TaxID=2593676 RepID=UPI0034224C21